jgi:hypothetical protein
MYAIVRPVQPVFNADRTHATLAPFFLYAPGEVSTGAKEQLRLIAFKARAGAAVHFAYVFIRRAVFHEHSFTRPSSA